MRDTKSNIIEYATTLFNQHGFFNVAIKDIADGMGISSGNLTYHFKRKEHLLSGIQETLLQLGEGIIMPQNTHISLAHFETMFQRFYSIQKQFRFYFVEMPYLIAAFPDTIKDYKSTTACRLKDARALVDYYIQTGRLTEESNHLRYTHVIHSLWTVSTFWTLGSHLIDRSNEAGLSPETPIEALWGILLPFLTPKGYCEYQEIIALKHHHQFSNPTNTINNGCT